MLQLSLIKINVFVLEWLSFNHVLIFKCNETDSCHWNLISVAGLEKQTKNKQTNKNYDRVQKDIHHENIPGVCRGIHYFAYFC